MPFLLRSPAKHGPVSSFVREHARGRSQGKMGRGHGSKLSGVWSKDAFPLLAVHALLDTLQVVAWAVYAAVEEARVARLGCSPLWERRFCEEHASKASWSVLIPGVSAFACIVVVYLSLMRADKSSYLHPEHVAIWALLHFHFSLAFMGLIFSRAMYYVLPLNAFAMIQDIHLCVRTLVSRHIVKHPSESSKGFVNICSGRNEPGYRLFRCSVVSSLLWPFSCCSSPEESADL